jgi:predicted DNA-binding transcriptional regulator YafY
MDGFCLDTTVFTEEELSAIFTGLKTLDSVSYGSNAKRLSQKISVSSAVTLADDMIIDLSSFYKEDLANKINMLKTAIRGKHRVAFHYYYNKGEADKLIEPYLIVFKWSDWYVFGFCTERQDFRMYKLRRLWELRVCDEVFVPREVSEEKKQFGGDMTDDYFVTAIYDPSVKYRLVEEYGPGSFTVMEDGRLFTKWGFTEREEMVSHFLSFGDKVEVIEPLELRKKIRSAAEKILEKHK